MQGLIWNHFFLCNVINQNCEKDCLNLKMVLAQKVIMKFLHFLNHFENITIYWFSVADNQSYQNTYLASKLEWQQT